MRWVEGGRIRNPYKISVGKPKGKRSLGRSRQRWMIMPNLKKECEGVQ
jgi:hypothetical protein